MDTHLHPAKPCRWDVGLWERRLTITGVGEAQLSHAAGNFPGHILHFAISSLAGFARAWTLGTREWRRTQCVPRAIRSLVTVTRQRWVMTGAALCNWGTSGVPVVPMGPRKVHVRDVVFPCPRWGRAGKWGKVAVVPPERATLGQNWWWSWKWTPGTESSFPAPAPGENFLLPFAVNCKSDWATDGKCWGGSQRRGK